MHHLNWQVIKICYLKFSAKIEGHCLHYKSIYIFIIFLLCHKAKLHKTEEELKVASLKAEKR